MDKIDKILQEKINETFNPNDFAWEYSRDFVARLHRIVPTDPFTSTPIGDDGTIDPMDLVEEFRQMVYSEDDEVEITYASGGTIILDVTVVKAILANCSIEQIAYAAESEENMHTILRGIFEEVINLEVSK